MSRSLTLTYGHGTHNDFLLYFDPDGTHDVDAAFVRAQCDRINGLKSSTPEGEIVGADGLIRCVKIDGMWFMDYRNNDGSIAEMCGNGIRVMARYIIQKGLQQEGILGINSRAGMKYLSAPIDEDISVNLGKVEHIPGDITVQANGHTWSEGFNINVGNPHAVVFVDSVADAGDLKSIPTVEPKSEYPDGVNVEFVKFLDNGELQMRVHERGVGETQSCGTGTVAVALAATLKKGKSIPAKWVINPPGGRLSVEVDAHSNAILTGPAVVYDDVAVTY